MSEGRAKVLSINRTCGDFVRDTQHLTCLEIGAYNQICDNIVILGQDSEPPSIPDDDVVIANLAKLSVKKWRQMKPRLCSGPLAVLVVEDGRVSQARVVEEIENARVRIQGASKAGVASGAARRRKSEILRERMLNGRSNVRSQSVQSPTGDDSNGSRTQSEPVTSHESRVMSYERDKGSTSNLTHSSSSPRAPRDDDAGENGVGIVRNAVRLFASNLRPSKTILASWIAKFHDDPWQVAALLIEKSDYVRAATSPNYFTSIIDESLASRGSDGYPMQNAKTYVEHSIRRITQ